MSPERLLAHYEQASDAPDAIGRLRRFILDLAVRGKLVPQDPKDEPASELLLRIAKEKADTGVGRATRGRIAAGRDRTGTFVFATPSGWEVSRLGDVASKITDGTHQTPVYVDSGVPFVSVKNFSGGQLSLSNTRFITPEDHRALYKRCDPKRGDILIGRIGTLGRAVLVDTDIEFSLFVSVGLIRFSHENVSPAFFRLLLNSPLVEGEFKRIKVGGATHTNKLNLGDLQTVALPIPPLAEQHRIVAKVDELMALCDRLEAARAERETTRDRLTESSLARLNAPEPENFKSHARFVLNTLAALTARPDQIKQLRQSILNLAVCGKLSPQDPRDAPASELLERIKKEVFAYKEVNGLVSTHHEPIAEDDLPFAVPSGWQWTRLDQLFKVITDGDHQPPPRADDGVAFLTIGNITTGQLDFSACRLVSETYFKALAPYRTPKKGDILYTVVGATYGRPAFVETDRDFCVQRHIAILKPAPSMNSHYLIRLLQSPLIYQQAMRSTTGTAQPTIALRPLRNFIAPLPPLAEQRRIAIKLDALMTLVDTLEAALIRDQEARQHLLEALIHELQERPIRTSKVIFPPIDIGECRADQPRTRVS
jgi:type I restriction enzyme, S subunit